MNVTFLIVLQNRHDHSKTVQIHFHHFAICLFHVCVQLVSDETSEALRVHTVAIDVTHKKTILKNMKQLYHYRILQCQDKTVEEEMALYPHLYDSAVVRF